MMGSLIDNSSVVSCLRWLHLPKKDLYLEMQQWRLANHCWLQSLERSPWGRRDLANSFWVPSVRMEPVSVKASQSSLLPLPQIVPQLVSWTLLLSVNHDLGWSAQGSIFDCLPSTYTQSLGISYSLCSAFKEQPCANDAQICIFSLNTCPQLQTLNSNPHLTSSLAYLIAVSNLTCPVLRSSYPLLRFPYHH